jgi:pimeloyl-ACP methyl ester carboxylesterase
MPFRKYTIGAYSSFYTQDIGYMVTPKVYDPATVKVIIGCHGHGGNGFQYGLPPLAPHVDALANAGYIVYGIDHARINSWGDPDAMGAITDAYNAIIGGLGQTAGTTMIGLMGWSMGGLTALQWQKKFPGLVKANWVWNPASDPRFFHDSAGAYTPPYPIGGAGASQGNAGYSSEIDSTYGATTTAAAAYTIPAVGGAGITINTATDGARGFADGLTAGIQATTGGVAFTYTGKTFSTLTGCVSTTAATIAVANGQTISATYAQQIAGYNPYNDYVMFRALPGKIMVSQANDDNTVPPGMNIDATNGFVARVNDPKVTSYGTITGGHVASLTNTPTTDVVNFYKANL